MLKKILVCFYAVILTFLNVSFVYSAESDDIIVKVGFFPLNGFNMYDSEGNEIGYNVEYLNKIAEKTGWKYEYVYAKNKQEALDMLENGSIDLMSPAEITKEKFSEFVFSAYDIGMEYNAIITLSTNEDLIYEDFQKFSKIKIGCVESYVFKDDFFEYAQKYNFSPNVVYYKDVETMLSALNVGEIDAVVENLMIAKENLKVVAKFSPSPYFYIVKKGNEKLISSLDTAIEKIKSEYPNFQADLTKKYFSIYDEEYFTNEEINFIKESSTLRVACPSNRDPVSYYDPIDGKLKGISIDIFDKISEISGLKFEYIPLPTGEIDYQFFRDNKIDLISAVEYNTINSNSNGILLSMPYMKSQKIIVGKKGTVFDPNAESKVAVATGSQTLERVIKSNFPSFEIINYNNAEECFDAAIRGEVDIVMYNQYAVDRLLAKPKYEDLTIIPSVSILDWNSFSPVVSKAETENIRRDKHSTVLISILNKSISKISSDEISRILIFQTTARPYYFTAEDFAYKYRYFLTTLFIAIVLTSVLGAYILRLKNKNANIVRDNEMKLRNITDNINGGVIVLEPSKGLKIVYANEGFLSLLKYSKEEYERVIKNEYVTFVHKDDVKTLHELLEFNLNSNSERHISVRLRVLRKDGEYIPTLFNGTFGINAIGEKELYCVIMDLSEQVQIMEELKFERERYRVLIEKSEDMMFDYNIETKEMFISDKFENKFGWKVPEKFILSNIYEIWHLNNEDRDILKSTLTATLDEMSGDKENNCVVRIMTKDTVFRWCSISFYILKKKDINSRIIGKITDVDDEMREKEHLLKKSQTDALTGLYNKEAFFKKCKEYIKNNIDKQCALLFVDLDNFKKINDLFGHMEGDNAIKDAAKKLQVIFSNFDIISRFGGDEFCVFLKDIPINTLKDKLQWTVEKMRQTYSDGKNSVDISSSIGVACMPQHGTDFDELLLCADKSLYSAKENGKDRYIIYYDALQLSGYVGRQ